jgi:hypothetical protein
MSGLKFNTTLTSLTLDEVVCLARSQQYPADGLSKPLADMLAVNSTLQTLSARGRLFGDECAKELAHMLTVKAPSLSWT